MNAKQILPKGENRKLLMLQVKYVLLCTLIYLCAWLVLYLMTAAVHLIVSIPPLVMLALHIVYIFAAGGITMRVMKMKGVIAAVGSWL